VLLKPGGDVATKIRQSRKLEEQGGEEASDMLLIKISEVDINLRH
jgi:hypothetical protein